MGCGCSKRAALAVKADDWAMDRLNIGMPRRVRLFMERKAAQGGKVSATEIAATYKPAGGDNAS
jgi:hypothetical protein